jgi:hypothetical protein
MFKGLLGLLFFGAAIGFGLWQLAALKRSAPHQPPRSSDRSGTQR